MGYGSWPQKAREAVGFAAAAAFSAWLVVALPLDRLLSLTDWPEGMTRDEYEPRWYHGLPELLGWSVLFIGFAAYCLSRLDKPPRFFRDD